MFTKNNFSTHYHSGQYVKRLGCLKFLVFLLNFVVIICDSERNSIFATWVTWLVGSTQHRTELSQNCSYIWAPQLHRLHPHSLSRQKRSTGWFSLCRAKVTLSSLDWVVFSSSLIPLSISIPLTPRLLGFALIRIHNLTFIPTLAGCVPVDCFCCLFPHRLTPYEWYNPHPCLKGRCNLLINQYSLGNSFWFPVGGFMQQGSTIAPRALSTRCVSGVWLVLAPDARCNAQVSPSRNAIHQ